MALAPRGARRLRTDQDAFGYSSACARKARRRPARPRASPPIIMSTTVRRHKECFKPGLQCGRKAARAAGGRSGVAYDVREHCPAPPLQASRRTWLGGPLRLGCIPGAQEHAAMRPVCNVRLATWRPVRINPQCELMPQAPLAADPLPLFGTRRRPCGGCRRVTDVQE